MQSFKKNFKCSVYLPKTSLELYRNVNPRNTLSIGPPTLAVKLPISVWPALLTNWMYVCIYVGRKTKWRLLSYIGFENIGLQMVFNGNKSRGPEGCPKGCPERGVGGFHVLSTHIYGSTDKRLFLWQEHCTVCPCVRKGMRYTRKCTCKNCCNIARDNPADNSIQN